MPKALPCLFAHPLAVVFHILSQPFFKSGSSSDFGDGRRYIFHNTMLQATEAGSQYGLGGGAGIGGTGSSTWKVTLKSTTIREVVGLQKSGISGVEGHVHAYSRHWLGRVA